MWLEMLYWIDHVCSSIECVYCACGPSESICSFHMFVFLYVEVISSFRSLRIGSQVVAFPMLFLCVILHLSLWYVVLVCHQYNVCENSVGSVYIGGYGGLSESGLCDFRELYPVSFLVVGECPSVLL